MSYKTIKQKSYSDIQNEYEAAGAILPGALVELTATGKVQNHSTAGAKTGTILALEDELQGNTTRDAYATEDRVQTWYVQPGEEGLALIAELDDPAIGSHLESAGDGTLTIVDAGEALFEVIGAKIIDDQDNHRIPVRAI
ncbi:MAG: hypothetical protein WD016_02970 [Balneolaceae bacterium]